MFQSADTGKNSQVLQLQVTKFKFKVVHYTLK